MITSQHVQLSRQAHARGLTDITVARSAGVSISKVKRDRQHRTATPPSSADVHGLRSAWTACWSSTMA
ncbi:hypothetical protein [Deinococcus sonorensis]|uniref:Resolvase HTH domain-containing protein n=1 Tax=Deinococcus sonorensis TaxID=309891 RepID=A0ABV8YAY1_9DEIO